MIQTTVTGNIGKDAEIKLIGEKQYSVFSMGVSGREKFWVQVCVPYRDGKLHPYLTKGTKILVVGSPSASAYLNRDNAAVAELTIWANNTELLNSRKDSSINQ